MGTKGLSALLPRYSDPFYRGRGRGRGRREWLTERPFKRDKQRVWKRFFHSQAPSERDQRDRLEEEWSIPVSVGRRGGEIPVSSPVE